MSVFETTGVIVFFMLFAGFGWSFLKAHGGKGSFLSILFGPSNLKGPVDKRYYWVMLPCFVGMALMVIAVNILGGLGYINFGR